MRYLIVVARNEPALYEQLRNRHASDPGVRVVVDRRGAGDVKPTDGPPRAERRRRRSWLATGATHELVELARKDPPESPSPKQKPSVRDQEASGQMSEKEILDDPQEVTRWLAVGPHMLGQMIPALIEDRDRLRQALEARERECQRLLGEVGELRRNLGSLQGELEKLGSERAAMAETLGSVADLLGQLQRPVDEIARRLHAVQPVEVNTPAT